MRVLVLGHTGFIGRAVARRAVELGHFVAGASRAASDVGGLPIEQHAIERTSPDQILNAVRSQRIDAVIDCAAFTCATTTPLLKALDGAVARYIMLSSGDVYRTYDIVNGREIGPATEIWLNEQSPLRISRFPYRGQTPRPSDDPQRWMDDYDKIPIEDAVREMQATAWTIMRLPMVYGPGDHLNRFAWATAPMRASSTQIVIPQSWAAWRTTYGYVDDVTEGILLALAHPSASNATFNLGEAQPTSHAQWAQRFAAALGWEGSIEESDDQNLPLARATSRMNLTVPLLMATARIRKDLGYSEITPLEVAVRRTAG
ncbi:MAG: NAD-dependent epimerase/dehydratase family protein [Alphaproteobacteria bacterium]|nr:NAD-dependent epimerase/dehydratase family protein [Alphaproteobacteria bacterium]